MPGGFYVIEDIGTSFLVGLFDDGRPYQEPQLIDADQNVAGVPSHQNGLVELTKQLIDHVQKEVATGAPKTLPIESIKVLHNITVIEKSA